MVARGRTRVQAGSVELTLGTRSRNAHRRALWPFGVSSRASPASGMCASADPSPHARLARRAGTTREHHATPLTPDRSSRGLGHPQCSHPRNSGTGAVISRTPRHASPFAPGQASVAEIGVGRSLRTSCRRPPARRPHRLAVYTGYCPDRRKARVSRGTWQPMTIKPQPPRMTLLGIVTARGAQDAEVRDRAGPDPPRTRCARVARAFPPLAHAEHTRRSQGVAARRMSTTPARSGARSPD
jgi:hypothetical protein